MSAEPAQYSADQPPIDIVVEDQNGGHTQEKHVAKSDEFLLNRIATEQYGNWFYTNRLESAGSFMSLQDANFFVNSTLTEKSGMLKAVASGKFGDVPQALESKFSISTGREAYVDRETGMAYMRNSNAVRVVIRQNVKMPRGYYILTAYPITMP